ncbi:hypothetical protein BGW80DRAFT_917410 [Lactifluus volemus]|nr:hypothetical protein BGW80DRAFT_917410 [Lactifluus volemus]
MPGADLVLRSADLVDFRVHKSVLAKASPFFRNLPSILSDGEVVDGLPVIHLSEKAELLSSLISVLYPVCSVIPLSIGKKLSLLAAFQKYDIPGSIWPQIYIHRGRLGANPFYAYAIACRKKFREQMESTAENTLKYPMTFETLGKGLQLFEGWSLRDLVRFRRRCRDNMLVCLESFLGDRAGPSKIWVGCPDARHHSRSPGDVTVSMKEDLPKWLRDILTRNKDKIKKGFTLSLGELFFSIRDEYMTALRAHADCHFCLRVHVSKEGSRFCDILLVELHKAFRKESVTRGRNQALP